MLHRDHHKGTDRQVGRSALMTPKTSQRNPYHRVARTIGFEEPLVFEKSSPGKVGGSIPEDTLSDFVPTEVLPESLTRTTIHGFPEISEPEIIRHFTRLSQWNYSIDSGLYPLGSCTMKYNPRVNELIASHPVWKGLHPYAREQDIQGALEVMKRLEEALCEITGLDRFTLQPCAGAHGELAGIKIMAAYHLQRGNKKTKVIVPDSAHGTNPASCIICGLKVVPVRTSDQGVILTDDVRAVIDDETAGIMITNPNTLGLFEENIVEIAELIHKVDGLVYMDGANYNALMGISNAARIGIDILHINLHKTFSTPHGGGGPGGGPVGVREKLFEFLPTPYVERTQAGLHLKTDLAHSIGKVSSFYGTFAVHLKALAYILAMGKDPSHPEGETLLERASKTAILNANYIRARLRDYFHLAFDRPCMHEVIFSDRRQQKFGVKTMDIAKRLLDYGFHPPTIYFPLVVEGAIMIEPTETESQEMIDEFCDSMIQIAKEAEANPELLHEAPHRTKRRRIDQLRAIKQPDLRWQPASK